MNHHYKKLGLRVPKDYFKRSKEEILGKINPKEKQPTENYNFSYYLSIAAIFIGTLIFYNFPLNNKNITEFDSNSPLISTVISGEEITDEYIIEFYSESIVLNEIYFGD
jgi:hypothetical protein|tara:strand:- start:325 stop:651 length:327 start_codon:yes stop_codon:yes gene_type:complete